MAGQQTIPKAELPFRSYEKTYGPFAAPADLHLDMFTKNTVVDAIEATLSANAGVASGVQLVNITSGQTLAQAITATQYVGDLFNLELATAHVVANVPVSTSWNLFLPGSRLGLDASGTTTSSANILIKVRYREYEG